MPQKILLNLHTCRRRLGFLCARLQYWLRPFSAHFHSHSEASRLYTDAPLQYEVASLPLVQ